MIRQALRKECQEVLLYGYLSLVSYYNLHACMKYVMQEPNFVFPA